MVKSGADQSCSICGRALQSTDEWVSLDGGEIWCAECWQQQFSEQPGASWDQAAEPEVRDEDLQLLADGDTAEPGVSRPCMNCGYLCPPEAEVCPACGGEPAPAATSDAWAPGTADSVPTAAQKASSTPLISVGQGQPISLPSGAGAPVVHQINIGQSAGAAAVGVAQTSGMAVTSFVLSLVGILFLGAVLGVLAVIFGALALNAIAKDPQLKGKGLAIAGLVIGIVEAAVWVIALALLWGSIMASLP